MFQAQLQRSLDSSVSIQPRGLTGRRSRKVAAPGARTDGGRQGGSLLSEQDSGILDVEDEEEEEEDDEVRKMHSPDSYSRCIEVVVD